MSASGSDGLSRYRLTAKLGQGGMGVVHRAIDIQSGAEVAIKIGNVPTEPTAAERFHREMRHAMAVRDDHVCAVYDSGITADGSVFLVMDVMSGPSLIEVAKGGRASPALWLEVLRALCLGLAAVHEKEIVHRDVKPQNVMFDARGTLKILDFGIARSMHDDTVTGTGQVIGTAAYMSPEQARAEPTDARSDLFSAALTAASLASRGVSRFAATQLTLVQKVVRAGSWPAQLLSEIDASAPPELEDVFGAALTLQPADRVASARALIALIDACPARHPHGEQLLKSWVTHQIDDATVLGWDADRELARARALPLDVDNQVARVLALRRASLLDPSPATLNLFQAEVARGRFRFDANWQPNELVLIERMANHRLDANELRRAYELFRGSGHVEVATRLLWAYCKERPDDVAQVRQLQRSLFGTNDTSILNIARGIQTGGLQALARQQQKNNTAQTRSPQSNTRNISASGAGNDGGQREMRAAAVVAGARSDEGDGAGRWFVRAGLAAAALVVVLLLLFTLKAGREEMKQVNATASGLETKIVSNTKVELLDEAQRKLDDKDHLGAVDAATRALALQPSVETGRRALLIRARAYMALLDKSASRKDLELYLERTTSFDDPNIKEVKRLLASLDAAPARE